MAYAFNKVDKLVKRNKNLGPLPEAATTRNIATGPRSVGGSNSSSTATESRHGSNVPTPKFSRVQAATKAKEAFAGKTKLPGFLGDVEGDIQSRKEGIITGAKEYKKNQKAKTDKQFGVSDDQRRRAVDMGGDDFNRVRRVLGSQPRTIDPHEIPSYRVRDVSNLKSDTGLKKMYRRGRGPRYTPGMAQLDVSLAKEVPGFSKKISTLGRDQNDLHDLAKKEYGSAWEDSNTYDQSKLEEIQKALREYITKETSTLTSAQKEEAAALNKKLEAMRDETYRRSEFVKPYDEYLKSELGDAYDDLRADLSHGNPVSTRYLDRLREARAKYKDIDGFEAGDMYTPEEASKYTRLMGLAGQNEKKEGKKPIHLDIDLMTPEEITKIARPQMFRAREDILDHHADRSETFSNFIPELPLDRDPLMADHLKSVFREYEGLDSLRDNLAEAYKNDPAFRQKFDDEIAEHGWDKYFKYPGNIDKSLRRLNKNGMADILVSRMDSIRDPLVGTVSGESKVLMDYFKNSNMRHLLTPSERRKHNALVNVIGGDHKPEHTNDKLPVARTQPSLIRVLTHRG